MTRVTDALGAAAAAVNDSLEHLVGTGEGLERRVFDAMRYSLFIGGKRLRPFLVLATSDLFDVPRARALRAAAAVEMVHTYSLIHDDLPAMDNDDLRRGQPTCHIKFDEATAILAGDGLLTLAFEVLAHPRTHPDGAVRAELVAALAVASGPSGMVGGQMIDLAAEHQKLNAEAVSRLQRLKTGALIAFSCEAGAVLGEVPTAARQVLRDYALDLGLAFQIADDLLDATATAADLGKKAGKDAAAGKATFISLLGVEGAREEAHRVARRAADRLDLFGEKAELLAQIAQYVVERRA